MEAVKQFYYEINLRITEIYLAIKRQKYFIKFISYYKSVINRIVYQIYEAHQFLHCSRMQCKVCYIFPVLHLRIRVYPASGLPNQTISIDTFRRRAFCEYAQSWIKIIIVL